MISVTPEEAEKIRGIHQGNISIKGTGYCVWCGELYLSFDYSNGGYQNQIEFTEQQLFKTDSVLLSKDDGLPVEGLDIIYSKEAVDNGEVIVREGEDLVRMNKLPPLIKTMYLEHLESAARGY